MYLSLYYKGFVFCKNKNCIILNLLLKDKIFNIPIVAILQDFAKINLLLG